MNLWKMARRTRRIRVWVLGLWLCASAIHAAERVHVVKSKETLSGVARRYGVAPSAIVARNQLKSANQLRAGQRLIIPDEESSDADTDVTYTVKRGDSVAGIAKSYGITPAALSRRNGLDSPDRIVPGQTLRIPGHSKPKPSTRWKLPRDLERDLDRIRSSSRWRTIVIHHSGSNNDTPRSMDNYHHQRGMENGLAYHFVIGNGARTRDGEIYISQRWAAQLDGGHLASAAQNHTCIGICLVGNFNLRSPTPKQMEALRGLVGYLMNRCHVPKSRVVTHQEINTRPTACPGKRFPKSRILVGL